MKNKMITLLLALVCCTGIAAQKKLNFSSQNYVGITIGEVSTELQVQTINGVKWKQWFGGIGTGIDWYYYRSIPVFASVNRSFLQKGKRSLFFSADAGINFPWEQMRYYSYDEVSTTQYPGLYWAAGFGYKLGVGKSDNSILLHFGYSYKKLEEKVSNSFPCFNPPCTVFTESFDYRLKRLSIRLGWGF